MLSLLLSYSAGMHGHAALRHECARHRCDVARRREGHTLTDPPRLRAPHSERRSWWACLLSGTLALQRLGWRLPEHMAVRTLHSRRQFSDLYYRRGADVQQQWATRLTAHTCLPHDLGVVNQRQQNRLSMAARVGDFMQHAVWIATHPCSRRLRPLLAGKRQVRNLRRRLPHCP